MSDEHFVDVTPIPVPEAILASAPHITEKEFEKEYTRSIQDPDGFWAEKAQSLTWFRPFQTVRNGSFHDGDIAWFNGGQLNVAYNCIDRHLPTKANDIAIIWEGDEPNEIRKITFKELHQEVCRLSNLLKSVGIRKGDTVSIYLPNCPECVYAMLACARIGAVHSVVFAGFSAEALSARILDCGATVLITADEFTRGGKNIFLKKIADEAVHHCHCIKKVFVLQRKSGCHMTPDRDIDLRTAMDKQRPFCPAESLDSEDTLFLLYTSGSTGQPKGMLHTQAGYLLFASFTHKLVFDYKPGDIYACVADVGWITGHSYIVYGPLCNGATTFMFESVPTYPDAGRYWDLVQRHKITQFYTAPTAIRALMRYGSDIVKKYDRSSLRILGTVGEPINPEAWRWYSEVVGDSKCVVVDTYWQTESGGHLLTPVPGATPTKPGSASFPFFGVQVEVLEAETGKVLEGNNVNGILVVKSPWPSIARTVYGDHSRYLATYMNSYKGYYFTGDRVRRDKDGFYWISGRVDDVINVAGHRLGTAEIESALVAHPAVAEAAVVAIPHDIKGQAIFCYCILRHGYSESTDMLLELKLQVRQTIGAFATPDHVVIVAGLPKTRSGKIMRRILRKIASGEIDTLGDTSTLAEPHVVEDLIKKVATIKRG